jgi:hypothetical protein
MHPSIRSFPSRFFYDARVVDAADAPTRSPFPLAEAAAARGACFDGDDRDDDDANQEDRRVVTIASDGLAIALGAYRFLDVSSLSPSESRGGGEGGGGGGAHHPPPPASHSSAPAPASSFRNAREADAVVAAVAAASYHSEPGTKVAVITPYAGQREAIRARLDARMGDDARRVRVGTVDGFQGQEADVVVLSCVRTEALGFLRDERRLCVALTRARRALLIVGSASLLGAREGAWKALVDDARARGVLRAVANAPRGHPNLRPIDSAAEDALERRDARRLREQLELAEASEAFGGGGGGGRGGGGGGGEAGR